MLLNEIYSKSPVCTYLSNAHSPILKPKTSPDALQKCFFAPSATSMESGIIGSIADCFIAI